MARGCHGRPFRDHVISHVHSVIILEMLFIAIWMKSELIVCWLLQILLASNKVGSKWGSHSLDGTRKRCRRKLSHFSLWLPQEHHRSRSAIPWNIQHIYGTPITSYRLANTNRLQLLYSDVIMTVMRRIFLSRIHITTNLAKLAFSN